MIIILDTKILLRALRRWRLIMVCNIRDWANSSVTRGPKPSCWFKLCKNYNIRRKTHWYKYQFLNLTSSYGFCTDFNRAPRYWTMRLLVPLDLIDSWADTKLSTKKKNQIYRKHFSMVFQEHIFTQRIGLMDGPLF